MSGFRAAAGAFRGTGMDAAIGMVGGFLGMPTGAPSVKGGMGEVVGKAARMKVDAIRAGAHYQTNQQIAGAMAFRRASAKPPTWG